QLKGALITVTSTSDSSFIKRSLSKDDASFEVHPLPYGMYSVRITFQGFEPVLQVVQLNKENPLVNMGTLFLTIRVSELDSVRVQEPPMIMKKDTLAYNTSRWQTQPYAPLAELLAKLPGVKVNNDGSLTVNGLPVDRILVNGKPFFNGDPKMALEHLPAEIIKQIQVYQTADERSLRLGIPSGSPGTKTINLVLKINRRTGEFGKAGAGAGPDGAYAAAMDLHHMNGGQQLSIIGDAGNADGLNIGKPAGGAAMTGPGAYGITRQWNGGINYRDTWNDRTDVNGSYMSSRQHIQDARQMHTLNIFPGDSSTILNRQSNYITENSRQQLNFTVEHKLDSSNSLTLRPTMQLQHTENRLWGQSQQKFVGSEAVIYGSTENSTGSSNSKTASADILFMHRGKLPTQSFSAALTTYGNHNRSNNFNATHTDYAFPAATSRIFNQHVVNTQTFFNLSPSLTYTIPIARRDVLALQTDFLYNSSSSRNQAFRFNEVTHAFDQPDTSQSNDFTTIYNTTRTIANYKFQRSHYTLSLGAGIERDQLRGKNMSDKSTITSRFTSFLPAADLVIRHDNGTSIQIGYHGRPVPLSVSQLQPVTTTGDSLSIHEGNPGLKQPFTHSFTFSYFSIKTGSQQFFNVMVSGSTTVNAIQNSVTLLNNGAQVFKPVNMNGATNIYANANYTVPFTRQHSRIGFTGTIRYSNDPVLSNGRKSDTRMLNLSGEVTWSFFAGKGLSIDFNAASAYNMVHYSQNIDQLNDYFTETLSSRLGYTIRDYSFSLTEFYCWNNSSASVYQPKAPILSLAASRRLFKRKEAEIIFSVADLLNQQSGAMRTVTSNSITDMWARTRGRYAMLSFIYNVSRFKKGK
ncbi:MAG TPA: outer membrane beta-barrel protein, partial [Niastella sp.]